MAVISPRNGRFTCIDMVAQITILLAESCGVILERCLVGVAEARIGETLVVVDSTDGIGLKSSAGTKSTL
jgi:hypothetical protein